MRYGPRKSKELVAQALAIRAETGDYWDNIAKQLGVPPGWLSGYTQGLNKGKPKGPTPTVATAENIARAKALRAQGKSWKQIARELQLQDWQWLRHAVNRS